MFKDSLSIPDKQSLARSETSSSNAEKLTKLWALSESMLGGVLHAVKMPFRGMIISSAAVILIGMLANFSEKRGQIFRSTVLVVTIKAVVSPHSPLTAYLSVFIQGLLGEIFFLSRKFKLLSALLLGITVSLLNGFQKILVLTLIYGQSLWEVINDFFNYVVEKWLLLPADNTINFSFILISIYVGLHLLAGLAAGIMAYRIPVIVRNKIDNPDTMQMDLIEDMRIKTVSGKTRKKKWLKPSALVIIVLSIAVILLSYLYPESKRFDVNAVVIMMARALLIITVWFYFLAPRVKDLLKIYLSKKQNHYSRDVESIVSSFEELKLIVYSAWKYSAGSRGLNRVNRFIILSLVYLLSDKH
ncbi:MAG TPA: hypothetical protein VK870_05420 [Ignavibacteriaceae bacterium]|nr:hypothetical protein [Ignavibacteriaceae bacterium]